MARRFEHGIRRGPEARIIVDGQSVQAYVGESLATRAARGGYRGVSFESKRRSALRVMSHGGVPGVRGARERTPGDRLHDSGRGRTRRTPRSAVMSKRAALDVRLGTQR